VTGGRVIVGGGGIVGVARGVIACSVAAASVDETTSFTLGTAVVFGAAEEGRLHDKTSRRSRENKKKVVLDNFTANPFAKETRIAVL
jgi:hypothetical protein